MILNEKKVRDTIRQTLLEIAEKSHNILEQKAEDQDFDPGEIEGLNLPEYLKKMLDPNVSKEAYAKLDTQVDESGNPAHQAFAIAAFALNYGEMDIGKTKNILQKAIKTADLIIQKRSENEKKTAESGTGSPTETTTA